MTARGSEAGTGPGLGVAILAAGASSRMGRPKLLLPWAGSSVVGHLIGQWRALGAGQIAVVCRTADLALGAELDRLGLPRSDRIENPDPARGMFSSIRCAAQWTGWKPEVGLWAIVLGDQPHLRSETLGELLRFQLAHPGSVCQPAFEGRGRHPVLLPASAFSVIGHTPATTLKEFLEQAPHPVLGCPIADPGLALDLDTPEDYRMLSHQPPMAVIGRPGV